MKLYKINEAIQELAEPSLVVITAVMLMDKEAVESVT